MSDVIDDAELVRRVAADERRGDAERVFCERYAPRVRRYAERHARDRAAVDDLTQEALLGVIEAMRAGRIEDPERLGAFLLSTCRYLGWDANRSAARQNRLRETLAADAARVGELATAALDEVALGGCLAALSERERSVVLLTYGEDWPGPRIAEALGTSPGNVRVLRHRALERLWVCLEGRAER